MRRRWGIAVTVLALALQLFVCANDRWSRAPQGDGVYSWIYARSLTFDHDIDLANDYALCGDPWNLGKDRGTGHMDSPFYFGPALFWVPVLEVARVVVPLPDDAPPEVRGACRGPLTSFTLYTTPVVGALALFFTYLFARRFASDGAAALGTAFLGLAGPSFATASVFVGYTHAYASLAVAVVLWGSARAEERGARARDFVVPALALAVAVVQRPPLALFAVAPLAVAYGAHRRDLRRLAGPVVVVGLGLLVSLGAIAGVYEYMYGTIFALPQGRYYIQPRHAHPFLTLFAPHGGLFYSAPVAWLAVFGVVPWLRGRKTYAWLAFASCVVALLEIYVSSSALDWDASWTVGARRLTTLTPILATCAAVFLERAGKWLTARRSRVLFALGLATLVPVVFTSTGLVWGIVHGNIDGGVGLPQQEIYGTSQKVMWSVLDTKGADLAILPAELVFAARYGLRPRDFRDVTESSWYQRDFRDLHVKHDTIPVADARLDHHTAGFARTEAGLHLVAPEGHLVFAAEWPFATAYELHVRAEHAGRLKVGVGGFLGTSWVADLPFTAGDQVLRVPLPDGAFDSGLDEIVFASHDDLVLTGLRILDEHSYPPP